ncbi:MAG: SusC/RagA family TonB-linked outer membrane protein [Tannerellaceae bacterium]|jgi:TonB-linked SusC/RagA family outer membrane protein|nr:SusC/RagA family TonB-linked outer membrane protein [Tannerellaceae bacterium]
MSKLNFVSLIATAALLCFCGSTVAGTPVANVASATQQSGKVKGTVSDSFGPIAGASLLVSGSSNGTITDAEGEYVLEGVKSGDVVRISFVGYVTQMISYNGQEVLNVVLEENSLALSEVVVTALGIKREKKALGYAMQELKGEQLTRTRDANVANSLAGKIAGVHITQNGTGVGGSTKILIRGNNSITGNNQPLIVVDGTPIDNFSGETTEYFGNSNADKGSGISDISPDDIENMSVLKGPAAAALYGSRAGNGVVMITTKKGAVSKGIGISLNSNLTVENPMQTPSFQNLYGQGSNGVFDADKTGSWGAKMDGRTVETALGALPYSARGNSIYKDFMRTGSSWTNSLEVQKATDDMTFRAAVTRLDNKGVVPNSGMDRTSITLRSTARMATWLSADVKVNYINQNADNRTAVAVDPNNIFYEGLLMPRSISYADFLPFEQADWKRKDGRPAGYVFTHGASPRNPYWSAFRNTNKDKRDRYIGLAALDISFASWLNLKLRTGIDNYTSTYDMIRATGNPYWEENGSFTTKTEQFREVNSDFLFTAQGSWNKFGVVGTAGGNIMSRQTLLNTSKSGELIIPDFYAIANGKEHRAEYEKKRKQINSLYATASLSWDNFVYLDVTARNDWSSTLPKDNSSYFYPSVGGSWVFSQMLGNMGVDVSPLTFGKLRVSWAQVGNDTEPYQLSDYFRVDYNIKDGIFTVNSADFIANPNLKSETIQSWELGLELRGLDNRLGLDVSYYKKNAFDQILKISVPAASGYRYKLVNAGNIRNEGWEIAVNATPVKRGSFEWDTFLNWSKNVNKVVSLTAGTKRQILSDGTGISNIQIVAEEGGAFGDLYGNAYERDSKGAIVIGDNGLPVEAAGLKLLGNNQPEWMLGWSNEISYKHFTLGFLLDMNYGGNVFMGSIQTGSAQGNLSMTLEGRENGLVFQGVTKDGSVNTKTVEAQAYWGAKSSIAEAFIYDATNARLREVSLGYSLPGQLLSKTPFAGVKASLVARNLLMIYSKTEGFDPEAGFSNSSKTQGYELGSMPTMRSIGFNVNVTF